MRTIHGLRGIFALALYAACGTGACGTNQSGNLRAPALGDIVPGGTRGSPTAALEAACGEVARPEPALARAPYLQQLTTHSVIVGYLAREAPPDAARHTPAPTDQQVVVTRPDGARVTAAPARSDGSPVRHRGEHQMWAAIDGLLPDTTYCYAIARGDLALTARTGFRTAPPPPGSPGAEAGSVRFIALGDSGEGGGDQRALAAWLAKIPYQLIVHVGDIAYPSGTLAQLEATVFDIYAPLLRHLPMWPVAGNHEYRTGGGQPFRDVFALPGNERWYSFDWGRVHFAAIDTEQDLGIQAAWLDRDLAATSRAWKVVYLHRPPYSSGDHGSDIAVRRALAPVLARHRVALVLAGHDHHYERMKPQDGVTYVVTGGGGRGTRSTKRSAFTAFVAEVIHVVQVEVDEQRMVVRAIDATGQEFDGVVIPRDGR